MTIKIFEELISCAKVGGFIIFATKLDQKNFNEYEKEINHLTENGYWKFTTDHTFYRYDKLFGDLGKFSNKQVKVLAYQRIDREKWELEKEMNEPAEEGENTPAAEEKKDEKAKK